MKANFSLVASAVVLALSSQNVHAQDVTTFDELVVTASLAEKTEQDRSRSIAKMDHQQIEEMQVNSVAETIKYEPNLTSVGANVAGNQSINIRGLSDNKVLQVIDGTRQNIQYGHRPSYFLDPALLGSVEVIKGPISSLYGSGAIGGVVIQNTLTADDLLDDDGLGGRVKLGYQSNGDVLSQSAALATKSDSVDWILAGSYNDSGDMTQGNGDTLYGTKAENLTGIAKLNWQINDAHKLGVSLRHADLDGRPPVVGDSSGQINDPEKLISRKVKDSSIALKYAFNPQSELINLDSSLYKNSSKISERDPSYNTDDISEIETVGFNLNNQSKIGDWQVLTGLDAYKDELNAVRAASVSGRPELPKDAHTTNFGAFAYLNYEIIPTLTLDGGVRYDRFDTEAQSYAKNSKDSVSPSLGLAWQAQNWMLWSVRYDEAFRAPSSSELYTTGTHFTMFPGASNEFIPNPQLNPEKSHNVEFKGKFDFENVFAEDKLSFTAAVFRNKVEDLINLDVTVPSRAEIISCLMSSGTACAGTSTSKNINNAVIEGYELMAHYSVSQLQLGLSYGQTRGKDADTQDWLSSMPADKWVASAEYGLWDYDTKLGAKATFVADQERLPTSDTEGPYEDYTLVDLYVSWEPSEQLTGLKVDFSVINATDENYRQAWTQVYQPGRSFRISGQYNF